jgi:hypothetical protein
MNRLAAPLLFAAVFLVLPLFSQEAFACSCAGRPDAAMALNSASAVFSGRVVAADQTMARFQVEKVWKGKEAAEILMLTGNETFANGRMLISSCAYNYVQGQDYVVYARASVEGLISSPCTRTGPLQDAEVRALDRVVPHKRVAVEKQSCTASGPTAGEIRILAVNSGSEAIGSVRTLLERTGGSNVSLTADEAGRAVYRNLASGEYTITVDSDGYAPRRYKLQLPSQGCVVASIVLLPRV